MKLLFLEEKLETPVEREDGEEKKDPEKEVVEEEEQVENAEPTDPQQIPTVRASLGEKALVCKIC